MTIEQFEEWSLIIGLSGLILLMVFIVWNLGRESKAGKFGMFVLFLALALGIARLCHQAGAGGDAATLE